MAAEASSESRRIRLQVMLYVVWLVVTGTNQCSRKCFVRTMERMDEASSRGSEIDQMFRLPMTKEKSVKWEANDELLRGYTAQNWAPAYLWLSVSPSRLHVSTPRTF